MRRALTKFLHLATETIFGRVLAWIICLGVTVWVIMLAPLAKATPDWWALLGMCGVAMLSVTCFLVTYRGRKEEK